VKCPFCMYKCNRGELLAHDCLERHQDTLTVEDRIVNYDDIAMFFKKSLQCRICENLVHEPLICQSCESLVCHLCDKTLEKCPSCNYKSSRNIQPKRCVPILLRAVFSQIKIKCRNYEQCHTECDYFDLSRHQEQCAPCLLCH